MNRLVHWCHDRISSFILRVHPPDRCNGLQRPLSLGIVLGNSVLLYNGIHTLLSVVPRRYAFLITLLMTLFVSQQEGVGVVALAVCE